MFLVWFGHPVCRRPAHRGAGTPRHRHGATAATNGNHAGGAGVGLLGLPGSMVDGHPGVRVLPPEACLWKYGPGRKGR